MDYGPFCISGEFSLNDYAQQPSAFPALSTSGLPTHLSSLRRWPPRAYTLAACWVYVRRIIRMDVRTYAARLRGRMHRNPGASGIVPASACVSRPGAPTWRDYVDRLAQEKAANPKGGCFLYSIFLLFSSSYRKYPPFPSRRRRCAVEVRPSCVPHTAGPTPACPRTAYPRPAYAPRACPSLPRSAQNG